MATAGKAGAIAILASLVDVAVTFQRHWRRDWELRTKLETLAAKQLSELRIQTITHESELRIAAIKGQQQLESQMLKNQQKLIADRMTMTDAEFESAQRLMAMEESRLKQQKAGAELQQQAQQVGEVLLKKQEQHRERQGIGKKRAAGWGATIGSGVGAIAGVAGSAALGLGTGGAGLLAAGAITTGATMAGRAIGGLFDQERVTDAQGKVLDKSLQARARKWHGFGLDEVKVQKLESDMKALNDELNAKVESNIKQANAAYQAVIDSIAGLDVDELPAALKENIDTIQEERKKLAEKLDSEEYRGALMWEGGIEDFLKTANKDLTTGKSMGYELKGGKFELERIAYWFGLYVFLYPACLK